MLEFHESLEGLQNYRYSGGYLRRQIFVDERPILTDTSILAFSLFLSALQIIRDHLPSFLVDVKDVSKSALDMYYQSSNKIVDGSSIFKWPRGLKSEWNKSWKEGKHQEKDLLHILENLLKDGGYYMSNHMGIAEVFSLAHYVNANGKDNRTVIFDGTGLADKLYDQHRFNVLESIDKRNYSNLHLHIYAKNLSLTFYEKHADNKFYHDFCNTIDRIAGKSKTLVVGYKDYLNEFRSRLKGTSYYFDYWGSMLGKNDYSKATTVFFSGVIDFGNHVYSAYAKVLNGNSPIIDLAKARDKIRTNQKLVMLYQLTYRSKLREYTKDDIHVYVPVNSKLAAELPTMFPGCNVINDWAPIPHPHTFILQKIWRDKSVIYAADAIRKFVRQEKVLPERDAIKLVWSGMRKQGWTRLRNIVGKEELAKLGVGRKKAVT